MTTMLADVQLLAGTIGPRGTGTPGEAAAADYVAGQLTALGLPVERHTFQAVAAQNAFPLAVDLVALLAVAIYPLGGSLTHWIAAGLALSTAPLLWHTIRTSSSPLQPLLPHVTSGNVVARIEPESQVRERAIVLAHLDTNRYRMAWKAGTVRWLEPLTYLTLAILASLGVLYLAGALLGGPQWVWWVSLLPAGYVIGTVVTLWLEERNPHTSGAHDNAASVAVALEIGRRLAAQPLDSTQVWLAFTGAEETDHAGLYYLLRHHDPLLAVGATPRRRSRPQGVDDRPLSQAAFVGLEGLGSGDLVYLTLQGLCSHYRPDPELLALAAGVAARRPELGAHPAQMKGEDEVGTLRRKGYRAICIAGRDPETGTLPHWHRPDDTADTVSAEFMGRAADYVLEFLKGLDS
jgi:Peptidase family M28